MRASSLLLLCAAAALPLGAQTIASDASLLGIGIGFAAKLEPPPSPTTDPAVLRQLGRDIQGGAIGGKGPHRFWKDAEQKTYLGYDLSIEPGNRRQVFQLRILPLTLTPKQMAEAGLSEAWTRLSLPKYPVIPDVRVGDTVAIDVMANPATGQKIVDYVSLQHNRPMMGPAARDFTLADAGLSLNDPRLIVNGTAVAATAHFAGSVSGPTVWFYLQGHGRFVLSLVPIPDPRFRKIGEVYDYTLTFHDWDGGFRMECSGPIVPSSGYFNLYVYSDSEWRPTGRNANAPFLLGSLPREEFKRK
jgi:hypothetical protein